MALIGDLERIISKVAVGRINPREVVQLKVALKAIEPIKGCLCRNRQRDFAKIADQLNACHIISEKIEKVNNDPPNLINKGGIIRHGIDADLDRAAHAGTFGQRISATYSGAWKWNHGHSSLKIQV